MKKKSSLCLSPKAGENPVSFFSFLPTARRLLGIGLCLPLLGVPLSLSAQTEKEVTVGEVTVRGSRIVRRADGLLIHPSQWQKESAADGYGLLARLSLPSIHVNEMTRTVTALGNKGSVLLRINGIDASAEDLMALDPKTVRSIEYIDNPGVRYPDGVAYVVNIRTSLNETGWSTGVNLLQALNERYGSYTAYGKINRGKNEWGITYTFGGRDERNSLYEETARYHLNDGTTATVSRKDLSSRSTAANNNVQLTYTRVDSAKSVFHAALGTDFAHTPRTDRESLYSDGLTMEHTFSRNKVRSFIPSLDVYYSREWNERNYLTANLVGTYIQSRQNTAFHEGMDYGFRVRGRSYSAISELMYEHRRKHQTWAFGWNGHWKYTHNLYEGDVQTATPVHTNGSYLYADWKGMWGKWQIGAGIGESYSGYRQHRERYNHWLFRSKFSLTFRPVEPLSLQYAVEVKDRMSKVAMISNARIRDNRWEWLVGNDSLRPSKVLTHSLDATLTLPRFFAQTRLEYRNDRHSNMAYYERTADNQFLYSQRNQRGISMFYVTQNFRYSLFGERLTLSANGGIFRFINKGDHYSHYRTAFNFGGDVNAYLGRWSLGLHADNGWRFMEGETEQWQGGAVWLWSGYNWKNCSLTLFWQHPFLKERRQNRGELRNALLQRDFTNTSRFEANLMMLRFTWRLKRGRNYQEAEKRLNNADRDAGILGR